MRQYSDIERQNSKEYLDYNVIRTNNNSSEQQQHKNNEKSGYRR